MHNLKNHKTGLFARMGGSFNRVFFILQIFGDELDPAFVTSTLGIAPTKSYRKGDERPRGSQYYQTGGWLFDSGEIILNDEDSGEKRFEEWLKSLPSRQEAWSALTAFRPYISVALYTDQMNAEFILSPEAAKQLSHRRLPLMFDPHLELDASEPS